MSEIISSLVTLLQQLDLLNAVKGFFIVAAAIVFLGRLFGGIRS